MHYRLTLSHESEDVYIPTSYESTYITRIRFCITMNRVIFTCNREFFNQFLCYAFHKRNVFEWYFSWICYLARVNQFPVFNKFWNIIIRDLSSFLKYKQKTNNCFHTSSKTRPVRGNLWTTVIFAENKIFLKENVLDVARELLRKLFNYRHEFIIN